jgi:methylglutaconyl-CoA hydratase
MSDQLHVEQSGPVVRVRIDAGPGNLFTPEMTAELSTLLRTPPDGAHVVHLCTSGPDFCLGRAPFRKGIESLTEDVSGLVGVNHALSESPAVTVADVSGDAAGFGVGLVAFCDVAIASPDASFYFPEVDGGFAPALVLSWLAPLVGRHQAFWLAATGVRLPAREACELGLVTEVAQDGGLTAAVAAAIELLCSKPPQVHRDIKRLMRLYAAASDETRDKLAQDQLIFGVLRRAAAASAQ